MIYDGYKSNGGEDPSIYLSKFSRDVVCLLFIGPLIDSILKLAEKNIVVYVTERV